MHLQDRLAGSVPWRLIVPEGAGRRLCVLWLLGWSSAMDTHTPGLQRVAERTGIAIATLDTAGHGRHAEVPLKTTTAEQHVTEVVAVYDDLRTDGYGGVLAVGTSYGGYLAALLTARRPVRALVLQAPADQPDDEFSVPAGETGYARDAGEYLRRMGTPAVLGRSAAWRAVRAFDGQVIIVEHELDSVIPAAVPRSYAAASRRSQHLLARGVAHAPVAGGQSETVEDLLVHVIVELGTEKG